MTISPSKMLRLMGLDVKAASEFLDPLVAWSSNLGPWQMRQRRKIVDFHKNRNPFYREFTNGRSLDRWEDIPIISKSDFQKPVRELISNGFLRTQIYRASTSGSTGQPFIYAKDKFCHALTWALIYQRYGLYGIAPNSLQARFYGVPLGGKAAIIERIKDRSMKRVRFPVFDLSRKALHQFVNKFRSYSFKYIYGYTNAIRHFCNYLLEEGIVLKNVCPSITYVIVTAEMCSTFDKVVIEAATGVPCIIEYGASEVGIIGIEAEGIMRGSDELLFLETDSDGALLITNLFNYAFPMIRYRIGDKVNLSRDEMTGRTIIDNIMGRSDDLVRLPNGKTAAGLTVYYITRGLLEQVRGIREIYVTQKSLSSFTVFYVGDPIGNNEAVKIKKAFDQYLQPGLNVEIAKTDVIRRKNNGKLQIFHSEIIT